MLSNLASYIFGGSDVSTTASAEDDGEVVVVEPISSKEEDEEDEWVVVGGESSSLNLGSLNESQPLPRSGSSSETSASPSVVSGEDGEEEETPRVIVSGSSSSSTRSTRKLTIPFSHSTATTVSQMKAVRSAQNAMVKKSAKSVSAKMLERHNMAVKSHVSCKKQALKCRFLPVKSCGINKQLKQC